MPRRPIQNHNPPRLQERIKRHFSTPPTLPRKVRHDPRAHEPRVRGQRPEALVLDPVGLAERPQRAVEGRLRVESVLHYCGFEGRACAEGFEDGQGDVRDAEGADVGWCEGGHGGPGFEGGGEGLQWAVQD